MEVKKQQIIFEVGEHRWIVFYDDSPEKKDWVDTNEYLVQYHGKTLLADPGGTEVFPMVSAAIDQVVDFESIDYIFASHQDPDIISSLPLWLRIKASIKCYIPWLWVSFIANFGGEDNNFLAIPDKGTIINLNGLQLETIPAHFLHSPGNFHLYDRTSKVYFSGDVGAAFMPRNNKYLMVDNFKEHITYMEDFHKRWFGSEKHKNAWCEQVANLEIDLLCPQHGAIFKGDNVKRFIDWFHKLRLSSSGETAE